MTEPTSLLIPWPGYGPFFLLGTALGLIFVGGLWLTVRQLARSRHPGILVTTSLLLRFGITLAGFYVLAQDGDWRYLLAAAAGFTLPRLLIAHPLQSPKASRRPNT